MIESFSGEYRFLSNFWPCKVLYNGVAYRSSEHAYQAEKADPDALAPPNLFAERMTWRVKIQMTPNPGAVKRMTRKPTFSIRDDWESVKVQTMEGILRSKFSDLNPELVQMLLSTGPQEIVEGNTWHDNFWGVCSCTKCTGGQNNLGKILMKIRETL